MSVSKRRQGSSPTFTKMKVYIRVRPYNSREDQAEYRSIVKVLDDKLLIFDPKENDEPFFFHGIKQRMRDITKKQNKEMRFLFDRVYNSEKSNEDVFNGSISGILPALLEGYNCSVFVYGATGAGKTFTMIGNDLSPGIIYRTMSALYADIERLREEKHFDIGVSYLEVYNENVQDLLNPASGPLRVCEDSVNGVTVPGMKLIQILNVDHLFKLLREGNGNRTQHPTDANAESSRSHAVFQVFIKMQVRDSEKVQIVKLSMIDLAGSERGAATNCSGIRFKEGANINKSLLALGNCINNLADGVRHIPYRDSKLTRLLKDSLGGNCQTVMIACVGPCILSYEDTYNTLKYASRARTIKTKIAKTVMSIDTHIDHYKILIQELQSKILALTNENKELKEAKAQPVMSELNQWKETVEKLYLLKKSLHQKILHLESKGKILRWRIKYKHGNAVRISEFNNSDDEDSTRMENAVNRMEGTVTGLHSEIFELWDRKVENDEQIDVLHRDIENCNLMDSLAAEIWKHKFQIYEAESDIQNAHLFKLLNLVDVTNEIQKNIITKMASQYNEHHNLLRGYNKVTSSMAGERKDIKSMLKGNYNISWEISPNNEIKKRTDMMKKFAILSVEELKHNNRPCPLSIQEHSEEDEEEEEEEEKEPKPEPLQIMNEEEKVEPEKMDLTFVVPVEVIPLPSVKRKINESFTRPTKSPRRVTPLKPTKKLFMKENVKPLPSAARRAPTLSSYLGYRKTIPSTTFKARKVPLNSRNKNL